MQLVIHVVKKLPYWRASDSLGQEKQMKLPFQTDASSLFVLSQCVSRSLAWRFWCGWSAAKGPFQLYLPQLKENGHSSTCYTLSFPTVFFPRVGRLKIFKYEIIFVLLQEKDELGDVNSPLTFDLNISLPAPPCDGLCPVLNDYLPSTYRAEVIM